MLNYKMYDGVSKNSKNISTNFVYFCFQGLNVDGHDYINDALLNGATLIVGTKDIDMDCYQQVDDINSEFLSAAQTIYNFNKTDLKFIGVTGTDGKTSVTTLTNKILNKISTSAYLGTSGLEVLNKSFGYNGMTTPFADDLYKYIEIANKEAEHFIMEVSSHAAVQNRIAGLSFDVLGFTNLSHEHLDFHNSMDEYFDAKKSIFNNLKKDGIAIINIDDYYGKILLKDLKCNTYTYGKAQSADFVISNIKLSISGTSFDLTHNQKQYSINSSLLAEFNVYNLVHSIINVYSQGYDIGLILKNIQDITVDGRVQLLTFENNANFILDFAHTPDSILKVLSFIRELSNNKLIVVGGSAGGRDSSKRSEMGIAMSKYADLVVFTEDDPRSESVLDIIDDMSTNVTSDFLIEENRVNAIKRSLENSDKNDIIVLLGKAGQTLMYYDGYTQEYIEESTVKQCVKEYNEGY